MAETREKPGGKRQAPIAAMDGGDWRQQRLKSEVNSTKLESYKKAGGREVGREREREYS